MRLAGYHVQEVLYSADETVVVRARNERGARFVLKHQDSPRPPPELLARWQHEYSVLRSIDSEWVVRTLGLEQAENGLILLLEDFGATNLALLVARQKLELSERLALAVQLAMAVDAVQAHGIVHGDISPRNVLVDVAGMRLKLCDFGLSSRLDRERKVALDSPMRGTLEYMSPEQTGRTNLDVDYRSDMYSLGACLYELFSGRAPFRSDDPMTLLHAQIAIMPVPLHELDPAIPAPVSAIVQKLLAKNPDDRYQSSFGLVADLRRCAQQWQRTRRIDDFAPGGADVPERFRVAQKLYGREAECATILSAFERAGAGRAELLLVSGYSGIGKTAVVREMHRPVVARRGYFLHGKCDQYTRNQPYAALGQAFRQLLRQLAVEGEERRAYWKSRLQAALGENAAAVAEIIPNLADLTGPPPKLPELPAAEQEARLHIAFSQFVDALAGRGHPLLLFLDDLQWADAPTLKLLENLVTDADGRCLLVVGAFRDNEVDDAHPLRRAIESIRKARGDVGHVHLDNLSLPHVRRLVADTLHTDEPAVDLLATLCMEKTRGNPFFLGQLLLSLHEHGEIRYLRDEGVWDWDVERIRRRGITDNVVELMLQKLRLLDAATRDLLAMAAHLGGGFDLRQLMAVSGNGPAAAAATLWPALQAGLVVPLDEYYKFDGSPAQLQNARFRFLHDRVQQAAHDLTPPEQRMPLQLRCGRLLLAESTEAELDDRLFNILHSLGSAMALIDDPAERARLLALNLRGGMRAKSASALPTAVVLLRRGRELLADDAWRTAPEQALQLYRELAEAEYLSGHFAEAEALYPEGIAAADDPMAKVTLCLVQADQYHIQGRFADSMPVLLHALGLLGRRFPETEAEAAALFPEVFAATERLVAERGEAGLLDAPEMDDARVLLAMRVHLGISYAAYQLGAFGTFALNASRMVQATLEHGQCDLTQVAYVAYMTAMSAMKRPYVDCHRMGRIALTLAERRENRFFRLTVYQYFSAFYQHWGEPLHATVPYLDRGVEIGETGVNLLAAGYCVLLRAVNRFVQGTALEALQQECERGLKFLQQTHQVSTEAMLRHGVLAPVLALRGLTASPTSFDSGATPSSTFFGDDWTVPSVPLAFHVAARLRHAYLFSDGASWRRCAAAVSMVGMCLPDSPSWVEARFYAALGRLQPGLAGGPAPAADVAATEADRDDFRTWADGCPENFRHKALLLDAELARVRGDDQAAMDLYAQAIDAAGAFTACEALANELYARYWADRGQQHLAGNFVRDAWYHYRRWGAEAKCRQLEAAWPSIAFASPERGVSGSIQSGTGRSLSEPDGLPDLQSLLKTTQFLAKEIQLESLLPKMLDVLLENAGAEQGAIVLVDDDRLVLEVAGGLGADRRFDCQLVNRPLAEAGVGDRPALPATVVDYVQLTRETLLLNDPASDPRFERDPYVRQRQPRSVMCLPVHTQGKLVALVYLENNLMAHAFTARHQQTLELLSSQAAISLVNARLYESLEQKVLQRTEELRQMSMRDGLTGIANRRSFDERLAVELRRSNRSRSPLSLMMIDIDRFKQYNDYWGHFQGDECIRAVANALATTAARGGDLVSRYGGEEFAVLLPDTDDAAATQVAAACVAAIAALRLPHGNSEVDPLVTISIGVCTLVASADETPETLITRADQALYRAKREGRNGWRRFDPALADAAP